MSYAPLEHLKPWTVGAQTFTPDLVAQAVGFSGNLQVDLAENPSWIAYWGARVAEAKKAHDDGQAAYRQARDGWIFKKRASEGKQTKESVETEWRTTPEYGPWYEKLASLEYAWNACNYVYEACAKKSYTLGAMAKAQADELTAIARARGTQQQPPF